jgi:hypothetical protein
MANKDIFGEFRRWNKPLNYYWTAARSTMVSKISVLQTLQNVFWPSSRFDPAVKDKFMDDGIVYEEYTEDAPFDG